MAGETQHYFVTNHPADMVLWVIGLGLGNERDVTVQGLEAIRGSSKVILEN